MFYFWNEYKYQALAVLCVTMMCLLILTDNPSHPYYQRSTHFVVSLTNEQSNLKGKTVSLALFVMDQK